MANRKRRSRISFRNVNNAAALFNAWMFLTPELVEEGMDREEAGGRIFYPSPYKVTVWWLCFTVFSLSRSSGRDPVEGRFPHHESFSRPARE